MTTTQPIARPTGPARTPPAPPPGGGAAVAPLDPMKLLKQYWPWLVLAFIAGGGIGVAGHYTLREVYPTYTSVAVFECLEPMIDPDQPRWGEQSTRDAFERFMGTQIATMTSDTVLQNAVQDREVLATNWARQFFVNGNYQPADAFDTLRDATSARPIPNSSFVQLAVSTRSPTDAATLVNAVSGSYRQQLEDVVRNANLQQRDANNTRLNTIRERRRELIDRRNNIIEQNKIESVDDKISEATMLAAGYANSEREARDAIAMLQSQLEQMNKADSTTGGVTYPERIREAARAGPLVQNFEAEIANFEATRSSLEQQGFGPNHPDIKRITETIIAREQARDEMLQKKMAELFEFERSSIGSQLIAQEDRLVELDQLSETVQIRRSELTRLKEELDDLNDELDGLEDEEREIESALESIRTINAIGDSASRVRLAESGRPPDMMSFPKLIIMVPLGIFVVVGLSVAFIVTKELLDQRVRGPSDLTLIPRLRILGVIPDAAEDPERPATPETAFLDTPRGAVTESYRQVRAPLVKRMRQAGHKSLLMIAGMPGSGATTSVTNLAMSCAASGLRVLIIDANFRRPGVHRALELAENPGLGDVLMGEAEFESAVQQGPVDGLHVLTAGSYESRREPERIASGRMADVIREGSERYDLVLIDAPPAIVAGDGLELANRCDAVALVVRAMCEKRGLVARLRNQLADCPAEMMGVIVNAVRPSAGGYFRRNIKTSHGYERSEAA